MFQVEQRLESMPVDVGLALTSSYYLKLPLPSSRRSTRHYVHTTQLSQSRLVQAIIISYLSLTLDSAYILHRITVRYHFIS